MMNSMEEQHGFEANFITDVSQNLKCSICHLVLRKPIQIMKCGHRFCKPCFERTKQYAEDQNVELCCPTDREIIDLSKVFEDTGIARDVGNLEVRCSYSDNGCLWSGDLRNLKSHEEHCKNAISNISKVNSAPQNIPIDASFLEDLYGRIGKIEDGMMEKEKEILYLKFNYNELKKQFNEKETETWLSKYANMDIENEMNQMKDQHKELKKHFESETAALNLKNQLLENKLDLLEKQLLQSKNLLDVKQEKMELKVEEISSISKNLSRYKDESGNMKDEYESIERKNSFASDKVVKIGSKINEIEEMLNEVKNQIEMLSNKVTNAVDGLTTHITIVEKTVEDNFVTLSNEMNTTQGGYSSQPGCQPGTYIPKIPQVQRAVNQLTRPRSQSNISIMASSGYQQMHHLRARRPPRAPMWRHEAEYLCGMGNTRNIPNQVMRLVVPANQPHRTVYKLASNTRNQYPVIQQQHPKPTAVDVQDQEPLTASLLGTASQSEQKQTIGDRLFPLVQEHQPHLAGKITGMLLEIDNSELLNMLESRDLLSAKVDEAVLVLQAHQAKEAVAAAVAGVSGNL